MFDRFVQLFTAKKNSPEQLYLQTYQIEFDASRGFIIAGVVLNEEHAERLYYFSNRRMKSFDDLKALYFSAMIINEKIDLELTNQRFIAHLNNNQENLMALKAQMKLLNDYYYQFIRDKK